MSSRVLTQRNTYLTQIETTQKCLPVFHHCQIQSPHHSNYSGLILLHVRLYLKLTHKQIAQMYLCFNNMHGVHLEKHIFESERDNITWQWGKKNRVRSNVTTCLPTYLPIILTTCIAYLLIFLLTYLYSYLLTFL